MIGAYYTGRHSVQLRPSPPVPPAAGQVQLRVRYVGLCGTDLHIFDGDLDNRVKAPQVFGHEMVGVIEALGDGVQGWKPGELVTVRPLRTCGVCAACRRGFENVCYRLDVLGVDSPGALQTLWTVPAANLHRLPAGRAPEQCALVEPMAVACHDIRMAELNPGDFVVVLGGGPIGLLIALIARLKGARVLLSEPNANRLRLAQDLGLDSVDPRTGSLPDVVAARTNGEGADVVFEVSGHPQAAQVMTEIVRARGRIVIVSIFAQPPQVNLQRFFARELFMCGARVYQPQDFEEAIGLLAAGQLVLEPMVSRIIAMDEISPAFEAMRQGEVMKVLVDVAASGA